MATYMLGNAVGLAEIGDGMSKPAVMPALVSIRGSPVTRAADGLLTDGRRRSWQLCRCFAYRTRPA
jgi:hypothetical protein